MTGVRSAVTISGRRRRLAGAVESSAVSAAALSTRRLASARRPTISDDRAGDEQHLVPAALVGEDRGQPQANVAMRKIVRRSLIEWTVPCVNRSKQPSKSSARPSRPTAATSCCIDVDEATGVVTVELVGACGTCPASTQTLKAGIERIMRDRVDGVTEVVNIAEAPLTRASRPASSRRAGPELFEAALAGDRGAIARLLSLIERGGDDARDDRPPRLRPQRRRPTRSASPARRAPARAR